MIQFGNKFTTRTNKKELVFEGTQQSISQVKKRMSLVENSIYKYMYSIVKHASIMVCIIES